jgi:hypothetical protein
VQTLSVAGQSAYGPQVAVDGNGNAVVVWSRFDGTDYRIQARRRSASGNLSAVQTLSAAGQDADLPQVAIGPNGNAHVVWQRSDGTNRRIQLRRRTASGGLSAVQTLSGSGQDANGPQLAVDRDGNAVVVWYRFDGAKDRIQVRRRTAAGSLSAVQTLSAAGGEADLPQVAVDGNGNALVVWERHDGSHWRIQARHRTRSGGLSNVQTLSSAGGDAFDPQVVVGSNGKAMVVWSGSDGTHFLIQARRRSASGNLGRVQTLSAAGQEAYVPQVALDADGNITVAWRRYDGATFRIQAARLRTG